MRRHSFIRELGSRTAFATDNGDDDEDEDEDEEEEHEDEEDEEEEEEPVWTVRADLQLLMARHPAHAARIEFYDFV